MKTDNIENQGIKDENIKLRRKNMNSTNLIVAVFAAVAVVAGGCSVDHKITGPGADVSADLENGQIGLAKSSIGENINVGLSADNQEQKIERLNFEATVKKSEVEGGCWYLETDDAIRYTPYFESGEAKLSVGQRLEVFGYVDLNMSSYCMIGDVFHVEKYTSVARDDEALTRKAEFDISDAGAAHGSPVATSAADENQPAAGAAESADSQGSADILKGYFGVTDEGCYFIEDGREVIAELYFVQRICPNIQKGASIVVEGAYSLLTWSPCQMAPLFNVEKFQVEESKHLISDDGLAGK